MKIIEVPYPYPYPDFDLCYFNRGIVLYDLDRLDEALKNFQKIIELNPDHAKAYENIQIILDELD